MTEDKQHCIHMGLHKTHLTKEPPELKAQSVLIYSCTVTVCVHMCAQEAFITISMLYSEYEGLHISHHMQMSRNVVTPIPYTQASSSV